MGKYLVLLIILTFNFSVISAKGGYDVNDRCRDAWMLLMNLEIEAAHDLMAEEIIENPGNYYAYYLDQTCEAYSLFINSDPEDYDIFISNFNKRREIMDGNAIESPYYLACYSEMLIQAGLFNVLEGDQFSGLRKIYSAYKKVYQNLKKFPDFPMSKKLEGFFNVAIGNLPPFVRSAASFFGVSGNIEKGFEILNENFEEQKDVPGINAEAALFVILTAKINKSPLRVYNFVNSLDSAIANTYIHQYFRANIAYRIGRNDESEAVIISMNTDMNELTVLTSDYLIGKMLMRKLDTNAVFYFNRYLENHKKAEYYKEIQYYIALCHLFVGDTKGYEKHAELVIKNGKEMQERDREALYDVNVDYPPSIPLIKAKLLLSGGYVHLADSMLNTIDTAKFEFAGHILECKFLEAGIALAENRNSEAIGLYEQVLRQGENENYYFASEAAMRLGQLYSRKGMTDIADQYFKKSLKLYQSDYYEYIEDAAIKGIRENSQ